MNAKALADVLTVVSVVVGAALVAHVPGYDVPPVAVFWLTILQPGLTTAVRVLASKRRVRQYEPLTLEPREPRG